MKLNVILAKTERAKAPFKKLLKEYSHFFKNNQGAFQGIKRTYTAVEGTIDEPSKRESRQIQTTVDEKFAWLTENAEDYLTNLFTIEATNARGMGSAQLTVNGQDFGILSTLELLRLKSILESPELEEMYANIPVRSDTEIWTESEDEEHAGKAIFQNKLLESNNNSTIKEDYILTDPNIGRDPNYNPSPQVATKTTPVLLGKSTVQKFSGEYTQRQRADILRRLTQLRQEVVAALKVSNDIEVVPSGINAGNLFSFLHTGKIKTQPADSNS